ncbi:MAG: zinc ribbon domain-containing protein [Deltaproteobacteria bacterium]|nr:zinc ribbon domain-containing protein [Deltaproteobacteria bacterium]
MPIYEYRCAACEHEFEEWQRITDGPVKVCPKCKKKKVERLISRTSFHLKGGGWYSDLYGSSKSGAGAAPSDPKSETKSDSKSDSKSDASSTSASTDAAAKPKADKPDKPDKPEKKKEKVSKA